MTKFDITRRTLLKSTVPAALGLTGLCRSSLICADESESFPSVRRITRGPRHHCGTSPRSGRGESVWRKHVVPQPQRGESG